MVLDLNLPYTALLCNTCFGVLALIICSANKVSPSFASGAIFLNKLLAWRYDVIVRRSHAVYIFSPLSCFSKSGSDCVSCMPRASSLASILCPHMRRFRQITDLILSRHPLKRDTFDRSTESNTNSSTQPLFMF